MAKKMVPLEIGLIDEGDLLKSVNEELQSMSRELLAYKKRWGKESSKGVKAKLNVCVTLCIEKSDDGLVTIRGDVKKTMPSRPPRVTAAMEDAEQDGTPTLFVRKTGSTADEPRQGVLTTRAGEVVDPETGEIKQ